MTDERLGQLLRGALPPTQDGAPQSDLWPSLEERLDESPHWSLIDIGLGIAALLALAIFPEWLLPLVYHM
jgi:hypothetical protein